MRPRAKQVLEKLGEPADTTEHDGAEVLSYAIGPFPKVRVTLHEDVVSSIVIHLAGPSVRTDVAKELGLEDFRPVVVRDDQHRALGEVYPERGLMFAYADGSTDSQEARVEHVILETITVEPFLLRAQQEPADHYLRRRADLEVAQRLAPEDPVAFGLAAHSTSSAADRCRHSRRPRKPWNSIPSPLSTTLYWPTQNASWARLARHSN